MQYNSPGLGCFLLDIHLSEIQCQYPVTNCHVHLGFRSGSPRLNRRVSRGRAAIIAKSPTVSNRQEGTHCSWWAELVTLLIPDGRSPHLFKKIISNIRNLIVNPWQEPAGPASAWLPPLCHPGWTMDPGTSSGRGGGDLEGTHSAKTNFLFIGNIQKNLETLSHIIDWPITENIWPLFSFPAYAAWSQMDKWSRSK